MVANLRFLYALSHTVSTRQSTPFGPGRARLTNESFAGILFSDFVKTRVTRPCRTGSEKHLPSVIEEMLLAEVLALRAGDGANGNWGRRQRRR